MGSRNLQRSGDGRNQPLSNTTAFPEFSPGRTSWVLQRPAVAKLPPLHFPYSTASPRILTESLHWSSHPPASSSTSWPTISCPRLPHVVIATPGRIKVPIQQNPDISAVFSKSKFLVLDEADRVLDVGFEEELRVVFQCLPKNRPTLLFSATMTSDLQTLLELSANKAYFYEAYEGFKTVESLKQHYIFVPKNVKDVCLLHVLSKMEDELSPSKLLLEERDLEAAALHSFKSQSLKLAALYRFKSGRVPVLLATDVASRGLDIPTVDLVINYDIPRYPRDYVHRVGRTARAGRGGLAVSLVSQNDVDLIHEIEAVLGKQLDKFEYNENEVYKARRVAAMKMMNDGFEEKAKARKEQKLKTLAEKGLLKKKRISITETGYH
ncbi:hypothetical protein HYC85_016611 [Camellia sinensis]|uniref:Helicase C-terminal domain-containing protein n=1 Tax=Camellia sinensis TaxID=4442 RepID=A0A7J7H041_CAMSI|nr:hypothetical protein HYC85_016611 [Camellia sinensis]